MNATRRDGLREGKLGGQLDGGNEQLGGCIILTVPMAITTAVGCARIRLKGQSSYILCAGMEESGGGDRFFKGDEMFRRCHRHDELERSGN